MEYGSEQLLRWTESDLGEMKLTCRAEKAAGTIEVDVETIYRALDGRVGLQCRDRGGGDEHLIPLDRISAWAFNGPDLESELEEIREIEESTGVKIATDGDNEALRIRIRSDIDHLMKEVWLTGEGPVSWTDLVSCEELSRLAPDDRSRDWHYCDERVIYLTVAASTVGETPEDLAVRVGGAMWAAARGSNGERVAAAAPPLIGLSVPDERFKEAAEAIDPHDVARIASSAMFVGLGGEAATEETLRLLTLLQVHMPVPRFF